MGCKSTVSGPSASGLPLLLFFSTRPFSFCQIDDLGLRAQFLELREGTRPPSQFRNSAVGVVQVSEIHGVGRADFDARRYIVALGQRTVLGPGFFAGAEQAVVAERALLHHAHRPHRNVRVQRLLELPGEFRLVPVEHSPRVGGGGGGKTAHRAHSGGDPRVPQVAARRPRPHARPRARMGPWAFTSFFLITGPPYRKTPCPYTRRMFN